MPDASDKPALLRIVELLDEHAVQFIVIGGQAEHLHGSARVTYDVDLCYRRTADNLTRLAAALKPLHPTLRDAPADLPFVLDARALATGNIFTLDTDIIPLDLIGLVEPIGGYDELLARAESYEIGDLTIKVIALEDLIRIKEHLRRPKDRESLMHLHAIRQVRRQLEKENDAGPDG